MENYIGKRLDGRYEIVELIGAGGMANVYRANDRLENREVAVKILREEFLDNEELVRRFKNESKAVGMLSHDNIVKVFDVNFSDKILYIVMEYLEGITLKEYIDHRKPLGWKDTIHFTVQILRALQHAHDRGIVHRDIKPQNIMLMQDGSIRVMDFGIARFSRSETRTTTNKAIGSVHYISPEQARGEATDAKSDIYSVGIMMYEMLTGELPFQSDSAVSVALKQISDEAVRPREIVPDIPEGLEEITLKAMAKDPERRYQSASQMLRDIDEFKKNPSAVFAYKYLTGDNEPDISFGINDGQGEKTVKSTGERKKSTKREKPSASAASKKGKRRRGSITTALLLGVTAACVICTVVLLSMAFGLFEGERADVELPNYSTMTIDSVRAGNTQNFDFTVIEEYNADYPVGTVFDQRPYPPKTIKEGSRVTLYVSKGPETVSVPDVVGMTSGEAAQLLRGMKLVVLMEQKSDPTYGSNKVVETDPIALTSVETGSTVVLYINTMASMDATSVPVPQVVGKLYEDARGDLAVAGLAIGTVTFQSDEAPKGTVLSQSVTEGSRVTAGTKIDLVVSNGMQKYNPPIQMPYAIIEGGTANFGPFTLRVYADGVEVYSRQVNSLETVNVEMEASVKDVFYTLKINSVDYLEIVAAYAVHQTDSREIYSPGSLFMTKEDYDSKYPAPPPETPGGTGDNTGDTGNTGDGDTNSTP